MAQGLMDIGTGTASTISGAVIVPLIQKVIQLIDDVVHLDENRRLLVEQLNHMKSILVNIRDQFGDQQKEVPACLKNCLERIERKVQEGEELIHRSQRPWLRQCIDVLLCKPRVSTQIREWKTTINGLFKELKTDFSVFCNAQQIADAAPQRPDLLLQDEPATGLIGMENKEAETQLQNWILQEAPPVRIIGIYGMGGVGKTALVKKVHNHFKRGRIFNHVIWVTVSQFPVLHMQNDIASAIHLDLRKDSDETRKMKLSARLRDKKFLLILDDMWSTLNLKELGVEFGMNQGSKLVFTTRNRELIRGMKAEQSIQIQPLGPDEAWELFYKTAFKDDHVPVDMENIARQVAGECEGLPLAIVVIAATMQGNTDVDDWMLAFKQIQKVDPNFPLTHPQIDQDLYQKLKWSWDRLPNSNLKIPNSTLKNCFLHCAMYPEGTYIEVEYQVQRWIAEGLVKTREDQDHDFLKKTAKSYLKSLENRCLLSQGDYGITVHDVLHDMAVYLGDNGENCVFRAGQGLQHFPDIPDSDNCKRISVCWNNIKSLPARELGCPNLVSLFLGGNRRLEEIPEAFLLNLASLRVLDLQGLPIKQLPTSLWQLTQLESLSLHGTKIDHISEEIGNLSNLQFLHFRDCYITSLPSQIGKLKNLKYLSIGRRIPLKGDEIANLRQKLPNCEIVS